MRASIVLTVAFIALLHSASSAQDLPTQDTQKRADALLQKARHLSDIRSPNAPPFTLKATFSFTGTDLETVEGTYTEVWMSSSQWRREIIARDFHRIEVAGPTTIWRLDNTDDFPEPASQLPILLDPFPPPSQSFAFEAVIDHSETHPPVECAMVKPDKYGMKSAFCFDKENGVLMEKIFPEVRPRNILDSSCNYGSFRKVGGLWLAREIACFEERHKKIVAKIVDLSPALSPDPALFTPPPEAIELANCPATPVPPSLDTNPMIVFGMGGPRINGRINDPDSRSWVTVWFVVDTKGKSQHARVVHSLPNNKTAEKTILNRLHAFAFKPGTCNGVPMPMPLTLQLPN
jgi:hypothetical protein